MNRKSTDIGVTHCTKQTVYELTNRKGFQRRSKNPYHKPCDVVIYMESAKIVGNPGKSFDLCPDVHRLAPGIGDHT